MLIGRRVLNQWGTCYTTGSPGSSGQMIILQNGSHCKIIRVCMEHLWLLLGTKKHSQILNKITSSDLHSALLFIWLLTMLERTRFSMLSISRFTMYIGEASLLWVACGYSSVLIRCRLSLKVYKWSGDRHRFSLYPYY